MLFNNVKIYFLISLLIVACESKNVKKEILTKEIFYKTIIDLSAAETFVNSYVAKDSTKNRKEELSKLYRQVFSIHKTNSGQFIRSFEYYLSQPLSARDMMDSLQVRVRRSNDSIFKPVSQQ